MKKVLLILSGLVLGILLRGQEIPQATLEVLHSLLEEDLPEETDAETFDHWYEEVRELIRNPVQLNNAQPQIERLFILSSFQQEMLRDYLQKYGRLQSVFEMQYIPGFDNELRDALTPLIQIETTKKIYPERTKQLNGKTLIRLKTRFPEAAGYQTGNENTVPGNSAYAGSREKILLKQDLRFGDLSLTYTGEKDAGESFFCKDNPQGFDLNSFSLSRQKAGSPLAIYLGDYHLRSGFGLSGWSTTSMAMGMRSPAGQYTPSTIRPYRSTNEYRYLRGAAASWIRAYWGMDLFFSIKNPDGKTIISDNEKVSVNLDTDGLHNTRSQIEKEKALKEVFTGGRLYIKKEKVRWGLQANYYSLHPPFFKDSLPFGNPLPEEPFTSVSTDLSFRGSYWELQSEIALYRFRRPAIFLAIGLRPYPSHEIRFIWQYLHPEYFSPYSRNPAGGSALSNSQRFVLQWECQPGWGWEFYARAASESNLRPEMDQLFTTTSFWGDLKIEKELSETWQTSFTYRFREETSENSFSTNKYRFHLRCTPSDRWQLDHRIECRLSSESKEGFMVYHELQHKILFLPLSLSFRYAFFDCPDYRTRIYAWERDVLYAFGSTAYYGRGYRWYTVIRWDMSSSAAFWLRLAQTVQPGEDSLGSGQEKIPGDRKTDLSLQVLVRF